MATRKSRANSPEFPILEANALYAGQIRGDGNCLFNALSDQLYGNQDMHEVLRAHTIEHMKGNADFYRSYMAVNSVRRNPKRRTAAAASNRIDTAYYTEEQLQQQFEEHVEKMGQPGEWADNMEVSAFASALNVHVRLWQADYTYLFSPRTYYTSDDDLAAEDSRQTLHIAYHTWEHYSSVRNIAGPHTGPPEVHCVPETFSKKRPSPSVDGDSDDQHRRARKRRSPLPLFDSDSTPEGTESSSDESNGPMLSQQSNIPTPPPEPVKPVKLTIKLRGLRTSDTSSPTPSRASSPAPTPEPVKPKKLTAKLRMSDTPSRASSPAPTPESAKQKKLTAKLRISDTTSRASTPMPPLPQLPLEAKKAPVASTIAPVAEPKTTPVAPPTAHTTPHITAL